MTVAKRHDAGDANRVVRLKLPKTCTDQEELLLLARKTQRTSQDLRTFAMVLKPERASLRAIRAPHEVAVLLSTEKRAAEQTKRKNRTRRLI